MMPIEADRQLSVTLTAAEWNFVLACIGEAPFKLASPIIGKVMGQIEAQQALPPNGEDATATAEPVEG
jgi:hypothetical protein